MHPKPGTPCWNDLGTSDRDRSIAFYTKLFGWTVTAPAPEFGGYATFLLDGEPVAGIMDNPSKGEAPDAWTTYIATPDARETLAAAEARGATIVMPVHPVGDLGAMAFLTDPTGAFVGLWQPGAHPGCNLGRPVGGILWHELVTRDVPTAVAFYERVFACRSEVVEAGGISYTTLAPHGDDESRAGVLDGASCLPEGVPAHWSVYFHVRDVDETLARIEALGGQTEPPVDFAFGRMAAAVDPTGARFEIMMPRS